LIFRLNGNLLELIFPAILVATLSHKIFNRFNWTNKAFKQMPSHSVESSEWRWMSNEGKIFKWNHFSAIKPL